MDVGVLVPIYRSATYIPEFVEFINYLSDRLNQRLFLTVVIDGCTESEVAIRNAIKDFRCPVRMIVLSKNFGVSAALFAGMSCQKEQFTVAFGSDLQEPLELFVEFVENLDSGGVDLVLGQRQRREDPYLMRITSTLYWWINRKFIFRDSPRGGFDVFGCNRIFRESLLAINEQRTNITSQMLWLGFRRRFISFNRRARKHGKSTWSWRKRLQLFNDSMYSFSKLPWQVFLTISSLGLLSFIVALIFGGTTAEHIAFVMSALLIVGFLMQLSFLSRVLDEIKGRPLFVIRSIEVFDSSAKPRELNN